jgi:hypothetical protein
VIRRFNTVVRGWTLLAAAVTALVVALFTSVAMASPQGPFEVFAECPTGTAAVTACLTAKAESGEVKLGNESIPVVNTQTLQGGFFVNEAGGVEFVGAQNGNTLTKTAQKVPGGLLGLVKCNEISEKKAREACEAIFENKLTGVWATIELAGPASSIGWSVESLIEEAGTALALPVKVKLENPLFGSECYIGSNANPIVVDLTTGTTSPPGPNDPISGKLGAIALEDGILKFTEDSLVNNSIAVPGASGCGGIFSGAIDAVVDKRLAIPAAAGKNTVILNGTIEQTSAGAVRGSE